MQNSRVVKVILFISGLVMIGIGGSTLLAPIAFHELNDIALDGNTNLLSEIRASGGGLLGIGILIVLGGFVSRLAFTATTVGAVIYLSYGLSRVLSIALDGTPTSGLILATVAELLIGSACILALIRYRRTD